MTFLQSIVTLMVGGKRHKRILCQICIKVFDAKELVVKNFSVTFDT